MEKEEQTVVSPLRIADEIKGKITNKAILDSVSIQAGLREHTESITKMIQDSKAIKDGYSNTLTSSGDANMVETFTNYGLDNSPMNYPLWTALYCDSWTFKRAIDKPAQDEVNCGFVLQGNSDFSKVYKQYDTDKKVLTEILQWGALYGGSIGVFMFDGITDEEYAHSINKSKIKNRKFKIYVTDRWYGCSCSTDKTVKNMKDIDFGLPMYYNITFADGRSLKVHHSWILRYEHRTAPRLIKNGMLQGWGYPEGCHILNELSRDDKLKAAIQSLIDKSLIEVIKMKGMRGVFMGTLNKQNQEQLTARLEMVNWARNFNSLTLLDSSDEYQMNTFSGISGLSEMLEKNMWLISAALEMQGILYGDLRGGFSQAADDMDRYATTIKNRCDHYFRPVLKKYLKIVFIVNDIKEDVDFDFKYINQVKQNVDISDAIAKFTSTVQSMLNSGFISKYQGAKALKEFINESRVNISIDEEYLNKLKFEEQLEILEAYKKASKPAPDFGADGINTSFAESSETEEVETNEGNNFEGEFENVVSEPSLDIGGSMDEGEQG